MKKVIDVSEFNGLIDWPRVAGQIDGVIIRIGYRGYGGVGTLVRDKQSAAHLKAVQQRGIPWGVYFLTQAISADEALSEAEFVSGALGGKVAPLGVWLDSEPGNQHFDGRADRLSKANRTAFALAFLRRMRDKKQDTGLYCADSWFRTELDGEAIRAAGHKIWLASVENVRPTSAWDAWQYTWKGKIHGIPSAVDISHFNDDIGGNTMGKYYTDTAGHWAEAAIDRMRDEGLMQGKTGTTFDPNAPITRAEIATVLSRLLDKLRAEG